MTLSALRKKQSYREVRISGPAYGPSMARRCSLPWARVVLLSSHHARTWAERRAWWVGTLGVRKMRGFRRKMRGFHLIWCPRAPCRPRWPSIHFTCESAPRARMYRGSGGSRCGRPVSPGCLDAGGAAEATNVCRPKVDAATPEVALATKRAGHRRGSARNRTRSSRWAKLGSGSSM